jgi:hypothetical protein
MKLFGIAFLLMFCTALNAQVNTSLSVSVPSPVITTWGSRPSTVTYVATRQDSVPLPVIIRTEITNVDGSVVANTDLSKAVVYILGRGTRIFFVSDVVNLDVLAFQGRYASILQHTGKLPAGTYNLSVQLVAPGTFAELSTRQTRVFTIISPQLPVLIMPAENDSLSIEAMNTAVIFRWTPLTPRTTTMVRYRIQVFSILPFQQPLQALRGNQPLLDETITNRTQFIWRPLLPLSVDSTLRRFIWTVQTLDDAGMPVLSEEGNAESVSEPRQFFIKPQNTATKK